MILHDPTFQTCPECTSKDLCRQYGICGIRAQKYAEHDWDTPEPNNSALRYDDDKPRFDLIPPEALEALATLYTVGAQKYAERDWEKGMNWSRCFAAMMRHAWAWMRGENLDPETGTHHMISVVWNAFALYTYAKRGTGKDDRPKQ